MDLIADSFLAAGAFGAAFYCFVLQVRLRRFTRLESGMGNAIAVLSVQVDDLTKAISAAQSAGNLSSKRLEEGTARAEAAANRLDLLISSLHDLPDKPTAPADPGHERNMRFVRQRTRRDLEPAV